MKNFEGVSDEQLALLYVQGNNRAFDELLSRTQSKLFTYIMFVVRDHDVADDIFQETFVKAITKLQQGQYTDSGKFQFWISRIAHNCIMDWYRQQQSNHITEVNEDNNLQNLKSASVMDICKETEMVNEQVLRDVKKMTEIKVNNGLNWLTMKGRKFMKYLNIVSLTGAVSTASSFSFTSNMMTMAISSRMAKKNVPRKFFTM